MNVSERIDQVVMNNSASDLAIGFLRYEAIRKLRPNLFRDAHNRTITDERFDFMVDMLVEDGVPK